MNFLEPSFLICKMGIIIAASQDCWKRTLVSYLKHLSLYQYLAQYTCSKILDGEKKQRKNANIAVQPSELSDYPTPWEALFPKTGINHKDKISCHFQVMNPRSITVVRL